MPTLHDPDNKNIKNLRQLLQLLSTKKVNTFDMNGKMEVLSREIETSKKSYLYFQNGNIRKCLIHGWTKHNGDDRGNSKLEDRSINIIQCEEQRESTFYLMNRVSMTMEQYQKI